MKETRNGVRQRGFTLIELILVVTIVGILAGMAVVNVRNAQRKAAEQVLKANLANLRKAIDDYYADKQRFPGSLQDLVDAKYMRKIPPDPITKLAEWEEVREEIAYDESSPTDLTETGGPGVVDVKSKAPGQTLDDPPVPYSEL